MTLYDALAESEPNQHGTRTVYAISDGRVIGVASRPATGPVTVGLTPSAKLRGLSVDAWHPLNAAQADAVRRKVRLAS